MFKCPTLWSHLKRLSVLFFLSLLFALLLWLVFLLCCFPLLQILHLLHGVPHLILLLLHLLRPPLLLRRPPSGLQVPAGQQEAVESGLEVDFVLQFAILQAVDAEEAVQAAGRHYRLGGVTLQSPYTPCQPLQTAANQTFPQVQHGDLAMGVSHHHCVTSSRQRQSGERVLTILSLQDGTPLGG